MNKLFISKGEGEKNMPELNKIYNEDCLEFMKRLPDESIDLILTDPPYNTGMTAKSSSTRLKNFFDDSYTEEEYLELIRGGVSQMFRILKNNRAIYLFINWKELGTWIKEMKRVGFSVKNCIFWDKVIHGLNYMNYAYTHEFIIFATKGNFLPKHKENNSPYWKDIWSIQRSQDSNQDNTHHETVKNMDVISIPIIHASEKNDLIFDPFLGSGTTAIACKQLKRNFIGCEISKEYCDIAQRRLDGMTQLLF